MNKTGFEIETYVGNVFIPKYLEIFLIRNFLLYIDPLFRRSILGSLHQRSSFDVKVFEISIIDRKIRLHYFNPNLQDKQILHD